MSDEKEIKPGEEKKIPLEKDKSNKSGAKKMKKASKSGTTDLGDIKDGDTIEVEFENKQKIPTEDQGTDLKQDLSDTKAPESPTSKTEQASPGSEARPEKEDEENNEKDQGTDHKQEARKPTTPSSAVPQKGSPEGSKLAQPLRPLDGSTPNTGKEAGEADSPGDNLSEAPQENENAPEENKRGNPFIGAAQGRKKDPSEEESTQTDQDEQEDSQKEDNTIPFPTSSENSEGTDNEQDLKENDNLLHFPGSEERQENEQEGSEEQAEENEEDSEEESGGKRSLREKAADKVREKGEKAKTPLRAAKKGVDVILVWGIFFLYLCVIGLLFWLPFIGAILIIAAYIAGVFLYVSFIVPLIESIEEPIIQAEDKIDDFVEKGASAIEGKSNQA